MIRRARPLNALNPHPLAVIFAMDGLSFDNRNALSGSHMAGSGRCRAGNDAAAIVKPIGAAPGFQTPNSL